MSGMEKRHSVDCCYCMVVGTRAISHTVKCWQYEVGINAPIVFPWFVATHLVPIVFVVFHFVVAHSDWIGMSQFGIGELLCLGDWGLGVVHCFCPCYFLCLCGSRGGICLQAVVLMTIFAV